MQQSIYLIDDEPTILSSLSALLSTVGWMTKSYNSAPSFRQNHSDLHLLTGCMLLDIRMPGKTGLTLLEEWKTQGLEIPVIIMTGHANIDLCRRAFKNGAFDFLTKPFDADLLFEVVGNALEHQERLQDQQQKIHWMLRKIGTLSCREHEIFEQIINGSSSKEIAQKFALSPRTIEAHRANIFTKLNVNSLHKLVSQYGKVTS